MLVCVWNRASLQMRLLYGNLNLYCCLLVQGLGCHNIHVCGFEFRSLSFWFVSCHQEVERRWNFVVVERVVVGVGGMLSLLVGYTPNMNLGKASLITLSLHYYVQLFPDRLAGLCRYKPVG